MAREGRIETADGEVVLLFGVNLSQASKAAEDHLYPLSDEELAALPAAGLGSVRLLTAWRAITPSIAGPPDEAYLAALADQARRLDAAGLHVVLDLHQDLFGPPFAETGAPDDACPDELEAGFERREPWWTGYGATQINACFDRLWSDPTQQEALAAAWAAAAGALCDVEGLVGFDLFNEPWPGGRLGDPGFEAEVLVPFYVRLQARIEAACPGRLFFWEPSLGESLGLGGALSVPAALADRVVIAPHVYPTWVHEPGHGYDGDAAAVQALFDARLDPLAAGGQPLWIGEWGGDTSNPGFDRYVADVTRLLAARGTGAALWEWSRGASGFSFLDAEGRTKPAFEALAATPLPVLLPGPPTALLRDVTAGRLEASFPCTKGRRLRLLSPSAATQRCTTDAPARLPAPPSGPGFVEVRCASDGPVRLTCARAP